MTVKEFSRWSGLGVTKTYELIGDGTLKTVLIGKRRLIVVQSYRDLIASQQQDPRPFVPSPNPKVSTYVGPGGCPADEPQTPRGRGRPKALKNRPKSTAAAPAHSRGRDRSSNRTAAAPA